LWAVHENSISLSIKPVINWSEDELFNSKIYLHPQLKSMDVKEDLVIKLETFLYLLVELV